MPRCQDCQMLEDHKCLAEAQAAVELKRPLPPAPSGACVIPITKAYQRYFKTGVRVLEIGCGSWPRIRDFVNSAGGTYEAIDSQASYFGVPSVATRIENLAELSFEDHSFDVVVANQTMEHWEEFGCSLELGLWQCFRVLKSGGVLLVNVPIHFHGSKPFLNGDLEAIRALFLPYSNQVQLESWGNPCDPLPGVMNFPGESKFASWKAYVLDISALKTNALPARPNKRIWPKPFRRFQIYPLSVNWYRLKRRLTRREE